MNGIEKIVNMMREQGSYNNPNGIQLGIMEDDSNVAIGDLKLDRECYKMAEGLELRKGDMVVMYRYSNDLYLLLAKVV